jgi:O-antigen ligase
MGVATAIVVFRNATARRSFWRWGSVALAGGGLLLVAGSAGMLPDTLTNRVASIARNIRLFDVRSVQVTPENFAVVERMSHLQAAYAMVLHHPLTGVGAGNYTNAYEGSERFRAVAYALHPWYTSQGHAHNSYLHIAAETGLGGLAAYLALLVLLGYQAWKTLRRVDHWFFCSVATGCCGIIGSVAVHNLFENLHVLNMGVQLGAVWGLLSVLENVRE